ncbi:hypothetical protein [Absidia glauca]|uniref:HTH APSES-type domain-containing protein n=1 Tax=Absidia glauca TaxID=4829 RepID=A0A163KBZ2_ABSGL|nr:hypothetical protein [Absidia glauca]
MSQQIYKATYSGVPVYEISCNDVAVMRRKNDSYMNATQILKVADFDKPQRTRILEREVQIGEHEKIQGGYGKYQGTWVPLEKAAQLAKHYKVDALIQPLLDFVRGDESPPLAPKHVTATSTKPRKPRERRTRKKIKHLGDEEASDNNEDSATATKDNSKSLFARTPSPRRQKRRVTPMADSDMDTYGDNDSLYSKTTRHSRHKRSKLNTHIDYMETDEQDDEDDEDNDNDPDDNPETEKSSANQYHHSNSKSSRQTAPSSSSSLQQHQRAASSPLSSPNLSSSASPPPSSADYRISPTKHKSKREVEHQRTYAHKLLAHFLSETKEMPALLQRPPRDLDVNVIIDDDGHTCLHWAAVMGQVATVQRLIRIGADVYRVNYKGQTALMRSVLYTNNYDQKSFDQLLNLLSGTIFNIDKSDQTVFHHVATTANGKGKMHASRYYMENLLNKLAHNRSELISILNVQDVCGDTALTIVSKIGNRRLVRLLIDAGASTEIANENGMTSQDYLAALDQEKGLDTTTATAGSATPSNSGASLYQSEEMTREQIRQKVDAMYKTMLSGNPTTAPSISHWVDDLAASYERDLTQKENMIKEIQRDITAATKRLEEIGRAAEPLEEDMQQDIQLALDEKEQLANEIRRLLLYVQKTRLEQSIKENEEKESASETITKPPTPPTRGSVEASSSETLITDPAATKVNNDEENGDDSDTARTLRALHTEFDQLQKSRQQLTDDIMEQQTTICEKRIQNYKRLISMCCNIAYENVDSMLAPILASFDEAGAVVSEKLTTV